MDDFFNQKYAELKGPWMTFFTPSYNRRNTLPRCYECLKDMKEVRDGNGTPITFEWLIIDDGSSDDTKSLVKEWIEENLIPIRYIYQENRGKHVAVNRGVELARAPMFIVLDSDDAYVPESLQVLWDAWNSIPEGERHKFRAVTARCLDPDTGKMIGTPLPRRPYYVFTPDMRLKDKVKGEMCGFNRVDVLKEFPYPDNGDKMSFFPEGVRWYTLGQKYMEYVIDVPLRKYYRDTDNALTGKNVRRSSANYYLWEYEVNNLFLKYVRYSPVEMFKAVVGMSMDGFVTKRSVATILRDVKHPLCKALVGLFMPVGYALSKR